MDRIKEKKSRSRVARIVSLEMIALLALLVGCQTPQSKEVTLDNPDYLQWKEQSGQSLTLPPSTYAEEPLPIHLKKTDEPVDSEAAVAPPLPDMPVNNILMTREVDVPVFLRALADAAGINILIGEGVAGKIRVNLHSETTWTPLFLSTVRAHGLHYEWSQGILRVMASTDIQKEIAMETILRDRQAAVEDRKRAEPMILDLYRVRYANPEKLAASIKGALSAGASTGLEVVSPSVIHPDPDSGLLIIHATAKNLERINILAQSLDQPMRQILIEATIVQANSETARELGMRWGLLHSGADQGRVNIGTAANSDGFNSNFPAGFNPDETGFTFGVERLSANQLLQAQLSALQRDGRLNIISSPSITTLDQQTAVIESGEERPFQSSTGTGIGAVATVEFKRAVLRLEVTPQVIDGTWIKLAIETTKDEFDDSKAVIIEGSLQVPIITRAANTLLYLADGETTVIGGLSSESQTQASSGIPVLKDLPLLGPLFRNSTNRTALSDTLIFITPHILPGGIPERQMGGNP